MPRNSARPSRAPASLPELYPPTVEWTEPAGRVFFRELPPDEAVYVLKAHHAAWAWCRRETEPEGFGTVRPRALLRALANQPVSRDLSLALVLLARQLAKPDADPRRMAVACLAVGDCAVARGARQTALVWAETAAMAEPLNPRVAWVAGQLHRRWDNVREAEHWLRRAVRIAVRVDDRYMQVLALNSIGNLYRQIGSFARSKRVLDQALQRARRHRLRALEGEILHDVALLCTFMGHFRDAEKYGALAFARYGANHPNLPRLAHDLALSWADQGFFQRALSVFRSLLSHFTVPSERMRVLAALVRCSGAMGDRDLFDRYWKQAWEVAHDPSVEAVLASTLVDLGRGAGSMMEWKMAEAALSWAIRRATDSGEADALSVAEGLLEATHAHGRADAMPRDARENATSDRLAQSLTEELDQTASRCRRQVSR